MGRYSGYSNYYSGYGYNDDFYDYDYGYNYTKKKNKEKKKEYNYSSWSWGSGYSSYYTSDNDENLHTIDPESYLTPKETEIRKQFSKPIFKTDIDMIKNLTRFFFFRMIEEPKYLKDESDIPENEMDNYHHLKKVLESLLHKEVPGYTPLEQAVLTYTELLKGKDNLGEGSSSHQQTEQAAQQMHFDRELYYDAELNSMIDKLEFTKQLKAKVLKQMSMIKHFGSKFKVEKEVEEKEVFNSKTITCKKMTSYAQLPQIEMYQRLLPGFNLKFAMKDLIVNIPVDRTEHKQKIIIMVDMSGSMCDTQKQLWVCSILMDRMKYVIKGEAELYFSYFVTEFEGVGFHHIKNKEDVLHFWKHVYVQYPNGGTTKVGSLIQQVERDINNKKLHNLDIDLSEERPEVLIINDGYYLA